MSETKAEPKKVVMFDLDGCVADDRWRHNRLPHNGGSWDAYHDGCDQDVVLGHGGAILRSHLESGHTIIFTTGRPFSVSEKSAEWIEANFGIKKADLAMLMRPVDDHTRAVDLKAKFADFVLQQKHDIVAAYDDREDVVEMYRSKGINACVLDHRGLQIWQPRENIVTDEQREAVQGEAAPGFAPPLKPVDQSKLTGTSEGKPRPARSPDVSDVMAVILPNGANLAGPAAHRTYILFTATLDAMINFVRGGMAEGEHLIHAATALAKLGEHIGEQQEKAGERLSV